jgi:hypothetical protein
MFLLSFWERASTLTVHGANVSTIRGTSRGELSHFIIEPLLSYGLKVMKSSSGKSKKDLPVLLLGVSLLTPPKTLTVGLRRSLWRGQETGHSAMSAHEFMRHGTQ